MEPTPKSLEYEPGIRRPKGWPWIVVVTLIVAVLVVAAVLFARFSAPAMKPFGPVTVTRVQLLTQPQTVTLVQRTNLRLSGGTVILSIGDVTNKQVLTMLDLDDGRRVFSRSMQEGDHLPVSIDGQTLYVKLVKLQNVLVGNDDQATFEISSQRVMSETEKIDALIAHLEALDGATFVRNGDPHTAAEAAAHLRRKRDYAGDKITTAEQFISELASKSSQSGELYKIKLKDGSEVPAGDYLGQQLKQIEGGDKGKP